MELTMENNCKALIDLIGNKKFLYISGNGGAGKTTYAKEIKNLLEKNGKRVNLISTDDFITNTKVRNNSVGNWNLQGKEFSGRYTSCCEESYFWSSLDALLHSLVNGLDVFYQPKRSKMILLYANADLTIVEGIGTAFMKKMENSVSLWFECKKDIEIDRRILRGGEKREEVVSRTAVRDMQFDANVLKNQIKFDYLINTDTDEITIIKIKEKK